MRDPIEATKIDTPYGTISLDENGDLASRIISLSHTNPRRVRLSGVMAGLVPAIYISTMPP